MSERLLIIDAGGFGREVFAWASDVVEAGSPWNIGGFLDANPQALSGSGVACPVVGDPRTYEPAADDVFICAVGDPATRLQLAGDILDRGGRFITLIHPTAIMGPNCTLGVGSILCPYAIVTASATLGKFVVLNVYASVGHNAVLGDGCMLSGHTDVTGNSVLGEGVFLGSHATVLPGAQVGDFAKIGAGSVVLRQAPPHTTVKGVPARAIAFN